MSRSYEHPATPSTDANQQGRVDHFIAVLRALAAHLTAHPGLVLPNVNGVSNRGRTSLQISSLAGPPGDLACLIAWAHSFGVTTAMVTRAAADPFGGPRWCHLHLHGDLDGCPVDVWTGIDALQHSDLATGDEVHIADLAAAAALTGDLGTSLAQVRDDVGPIPFVAVEPTTCAHCGRTITDLGGDWIDQAGDGLCRNAANGLHHPAAAS